MPSKVKIIDKSELEKMHTGSLMTRRKALLACEESLAHSDREQNYKVESGYIEFKQDPNWELAHRELKEVLANREHWPRKR